MMRSKRGKRPADWMYQVHKHGIPKGVNATYRGIADYLETTPQAIRRFCQRQDLVGEYQLQENAVVKLLDLMKLRKIVTQYIEEYEK